MSDTDLPAIVVDLSPRSAALLRCEFPSVTAEEVCNLISSQVSSRVLSGEGPPSFLIGGPLTSLLFPCFPLIGTVHKVNEHLCRLLVVRCDEYTSPLSHIYPPGADIIRDSLEILTELSN